MARFARLVVKLALLLVLAWALYLVVARTDVPWLPAQFARATPHEAYADALRRSGLHETALGRAWLAEAERVLADPLGAPLPLHEVAWFPASEARAAAWRLELQRGQHLEVTAAVDATEPTRVFVDLFEVRAGDAAPRHVAHASDDGLVLDAEVRQTGIYILRVQPELLRSARVTVTQSVRAALAFPVPGFDRRAVQSVFGAARDGGRREHHGIDIFAPRNTPVAAAADGVVTSIGTNALGGNVVWIWDQARRQSHYYAHLETQEVTTGQRVTAGDTVVGTVGNTGNARNTAPHLHFGIYAMGEGPIDPLPFVVQTVGAPPRLTASPEALGASLRVRTPAAPLRRAASARADVLLQLERHTVVRIEGAAAGFHRVRLPDGSEGYMTATAVEPLAVPLRQLARRKGTLLLHAPQPDALALATLEPGTPAAVLGQFGTYLFVRAGELEGWIGLSEPDTSTDASRPAARYRTSRATPSITRSTSSSVV
jgi:peptidoglycan LD-endopeptidase LytH